MLKKEDLIQLGKLAINAQSSTPVAYSFGAEQYSYDDLMDTFREELNQYAGNYALYRQNKNLIFELMEELIDDVLPKKVLEQYGQFAEIKTYNQGDKPIFTQRITQASRRRAQQFVTKVGLAGVYEVFKLDGQSYEVPTSAYGGAAQIGFEEMLDGRVTMADVLDIILEGIDRCVYIEIERALKSAVENLQGANKHSTNGFSEVDFDRLISVADSYGKSTIYCTYEFASTMIPASGWISDAMKDAKWNNGYLGNYKGHNVIILAQSFEDEKNTVKVIDPAYAWIIPTGSGNEKPVKVAFEGQTIVREFENRDYSREVQVYKKMGVGAIITNNICVYVNKDLTR